MVKKILKEFIPPILVHLIKKLYAVFHPRKDKEALTNWLRADGDRTFRLDYPDLNESSIVFDIGAYKGEWSKNIFCKYMPQIYIFEPVTSFYEEIDNSFKNNTKVHVFKIGFSNKELDTSISLADDSSSIFNITSINKTEQIHITTLSSFIKENSIANIDLIKINIEGSEFDVIEDLFNHDLIKNIRQFQIQFHNFSDDAKTRMDKCRMMLSKTHNQDWNFEFVWEGWTRKE